MSKTMHSMNAWLLVLDNARRAFAYLPQTMRMGLGLASLGAVIDIAYHVGTNARSGHGAVAFIGHLVTLIGMIVTMLGLIGAAYKRRPGAARKTQKGVAR
jgi:hypothetical protein